MKIKCPNCGFEDEDNFCSQCGTALLKLAASSDVSHTKRQNVQRKLGEEHNRILMELDKTNLAA